MRISDWSSDVCSSDLRPYDWIVAGKKAGDPDVVHPTRGVRQIVKRVVHGSNFMMEAMTLYLTMDRDALVVAAKPTGHSNANSCPQEKLVNFCGTLDLKYGLNIARLQMNGQKHDYLTAARSIRTKKNHYG